MVSNEYLKKLSKRFKQKAMLLVSNPDFQDDILRLRKKWSIPKEGIKSNEESEKWHRNLYIAADQYTKEEWSKHRSELDKLKKQGKYLKLEKRQKELNDAGPINAFRIDIKLMVKKYNLSPRWEESIRRYLLFNNVNNIGGFLGISIRTETDPESDIKKILLEIDEDTTLEDVKQFWSTIKFHQEHLRYKKQKKFQPITYLERNKDAYELLKTGKSYKEIADILSRKYKKIYTYFEIGDFIKRHKLKVGIN